MFDALLRDVGFGDLVGHPVGLVAWGLLLPGPSLVDVYLVRAFLPEAEFLLVCVPFGTRGIEPTGRLERCLSRGLPGKNARLFTVLLSKCEVPLAVFSYHGGIHHDNSEHATI